MNRTAVVCTSIASLSLVGAVALLPAGPLDPPAGPVAPTYKTLTEVEPRIAINATNTPGDADSVFKITQPGSYYLTGNLTGATGKHGIEIAVGGVTVDLGGFELVGVPGMGAFDGVTVSVINLANITVLNGSVRGWGSNGVHLGSTGGCRVEGVHAVGNASTGIDTGGSGGTVANCSARSNLGGGIHVGIASTVTGCVAGSNASSGISSSFACTIVNCAAYSNDQIGISLGNGGAIKNCAARSNSIHGISTTDACTITDCSASLNDSIGINAGDGCTITGCSAVGNTGVGISTDLGAAISRCTANSNGENGIFADAGSSIHHCTSTGNALNGIATTSDCTIIGNTCDGNGASDADGAGIVVSGGDNRIEGNQCTDADRGIDVNAAGNIIVRNTCSGNATNWTIGANNYYGPIINRFGLLTSSVNGDAASSTLGSTDANANFTY